MSELPPLSAFGARIMVCGPSNSGKSTLAVALGRKLGLETFHLDLFRHLPDTDWVQRPDAEFLAMHDEAITHDRWVMEGNYSKLFPQRIARATGIILLGDNRWANFARYVRRTLFQKRQRPGSLAGDKDSLKWDMVHWILVTSPRNLETYRRTLPQAGPPFLERRGMGELNALYEAWNLTRD